MKILVFGAGVLGCNLARNFFRAGKDVTLLARGTWAEEIQKNGLRIKDKFLPRISVSRIPVVTGLMHARLIRTQTEALGGDHCDYWYVGDQSPVLKDYANLEQI